MPQKGEIWRHYKNDDQEYEIVGLSIHTETEEILVVYKPLYDLKFVQENNVNFCCRPLTMWNEYVEKENYKGPRFIKVR